MITVISCLRRVFSPFSGRKCFPKSNNVCFYYDLYLKWNYYIAFTAFDFRGNRKWKHHGIYKKFYCIYNLILLPLRKFSVFISLLAYRIMASFIPLFMNVPYVCWRFGFIKYRFFHVRR